jgi:hypothetical protein
MLFLILTAVAGAMTLVSGSIAIRDAIKSYPGPKYRIGWGLTIITLLLTLVFLFASLPSLRSADVGNISTPTSNPPQPSTGSTPVQSTSKPALIPTPTPCPTNPCILYQADSSWSGWNGSGGWKVSGGLLLNDGTYADYQTMPTITAPYQPGGIADYAVVIKMQVVNAMTTGTIYPCLYITARGTSVSDGWHGYADAICANSANGQAAQINAIDTTNNMYDRLNSTPFDPQNAWHTYRLEVKGTAIRFLVDGGALLTADDSKFLGAGQIGLRSDYMEVKISSFNIIAL